MPLTLYRRHRKECEGGHAEDSRSGEFEEGRRGWRKCGCLIHVSGTLAGRFSRRQTGKANWEEAKAVVAIWESARSWDGHGTTEEAAAQAPEPVLPEQVTVERAIEAFTSEFEKYTAPNTQKKYRLLLKKLKGFSESKGYVLLEQWDPIDVRDFRSSWSVSPQTAAKNMSIVKAFFEFCLANEWTVRNPARLVRNPRGRDAADRRNEQKLPFSDEELRKMYEACETKYGKQEIKWSRVIHNRHVQGQYARHNQKLDRPGCRGLHLCLGLYRPSHFGRKHIPYRPASTDRRDPAQNHEGRYPCLHMGARMAAGAHSRARSRERSLCVRGARNQRHECGDRCLAAQTEKAVDALRSLEGEANSPPVPAYVCAHLASTSGRHRARCRRTPRQHGTDGPTTLRGVDSGASSAFDGGTESCLRR